MKNLSFRLATCAGYPILFLLCASLGSAQVSAVLSGTVTDQSGGTVSGATATAKSIDTGATRTTVTDGAGRYQVFALPLGHYEIRVKKSGFAEEVRTGIHLVVGQYVGAYVSASSRRILRKGDPS